MDLCIVVVAILVSVPSSPSAPRPMSPMPHHLIIVDRDVLFPLPNSGTVSQPEKRECARVISHNIDVFIFLVDERFDQAVDVYPYTVSSPPHLHCKFM